MLPRFILPSHRLWQLVLRLLKRTSSIKQEALFNNQMLISKIKQCSEKIPPTTLPCQHLLTPLPGPRPVCLIKVYLLSFVTTESPVQQCTGLALGCKRGLEQLKGERAKHFGIFTGKVIQVHSSHRHLGSRRSSTCNHHPSSRCIFQAEPNLLTRLFAFAIPKRRSFPF